MKFVEIFRFELAYQAGRVSTWLVFAALVAFAILTTRDNSLAEALYDDFFLNSPFAIAKTTVLGTMLWLLVAAIVAGGAAARDVATRMHPLTWTAPVSTAQYLGGRFLAALSLNALMLLAVQAGILVAIYSPDIDPELLGPFRPAAFLTAWAIISLPNAFVATAVQFWLSTRSGRPMAGYFGSFLLFFMGFFISAMVLYHRRLGTLLDPTGMRFIIEDLAHLWTPSEKRWRMLAMEGTVLKNRLVWLGVGATALAWTFARFRFEHRTAPSRFLGFLGVPRGSKRKAAQSRAASIHSEELRGTPRNSEEPRNRGTVVVLNVPRAFGLATRARQTVAIAWDSFRTLVASRVGLALVAGLPLMTFAVVLDQMTSASVRRIPGTALVLSDLTAPLSSAMSRWAVIPLLIIFFAGELVWRERDAGLGDLTDAMPAPEWPRFLGKFLGLSSVIAGIMALLAAGGMLAQLSLGHRDFEPALYLKILFGLQLPEYLLFALLALVMHVVVNHKYIGHLAIIVVSAAIMQPSLFGLEHNLLVYSAGPVWSWTEMRGFGATFAPWLWFKLYWAAWALLLAMGARLLTARGNDVDLRARLRLARGRFTRSTAVAVAVAMALVVALGGFIFYNTNVLHEYRTDFENKELAAEYERRYGKYKGIPQPRMAATRLRVELHPERRAMDIQGTYDLVNRSASAIDSVHLAFIPGGKTRAIAFDRAAALVVNDDVRGHRMYRLQQPLQPGESLQLRFNVHVAPRGFSNHGVHPSTVVANGTYFSNEDWLPAIGYQPRRELTTPSDRREHGLPARPLIPSIHDKSAPMNVSERTTLDVVVGTDADQVAVVPGELRRTWIEKGRRYFHYITDGAIGNDYAFFSARYSLREARWNDVAIRVFHHPTHTVNADRFVRSIAQSLEYYSREYGRYPYRHLTAVEIRGNEIGMQASPALIRFSEETALMNPGAGELDVPFNIMAHEIAHQWWGHRLEPAFVAGGPVLGEGLAVYSTMGIVEETGGREQLRRLLEFMREPYPYAPIRRGEPLLRGIDPYLAYRRGPFALHVLTESIGRDRVHLALRQLLAKHPAGEAPLATMLGLYRELKTVTPPQHHELLRELFEVNTIWDFDMERATAKQTSAGAWQVRLEVKASKIVFDESGTETAVPLNEWVEIAVFADGRKRTPLYEQKHRIRAGKQTITVTVPKKPVLAGIDPHHILDWEEREDDDNVRPVR